MNAAFCHAHPLGSRFNPPSRGAWYAAFAVETAQAEVAYHKSIELAETNWFDEEVTYDDYLADFSAAFHDIRNDARFANCLAPDSYMRSQELAAASRRRLARRHLSERSPPRRNLRRLLSAAAGDERAQGQDLPLRVEGPAEAGDFCSLMCAPARVGARMGAMTVRSRSKRLRQTSQQAGCWSMIRGEWDGLIPDDDARWLFDAFSASPTKRDIKISRATHLMHLETMRFALYRETTAFLLGGDHAPAAQPRGFGNASTIKTGKPSCLS